MVALLAGLKLRLLRNRRTMGLGVAGQVIALLLAVAIGALVGLAFSLLRGSPDTAIVVMANVSASLLLAWMIMPIVAFGVDETVDPRRFALLPIPRPALQRGLLAAALVGYLPLANLLALMGMAVGLARSWSMLPLTLAAALGLLFMCVIGSRALAATMAGLLGSRRGRDLGMLLSFALFAVYYIFSTMLGSQRAESFAGGAAGSIGRVLAYTPPGALAVLPSDLVDGNWPQVAIRGALVVAAFAVGWRWWGWALERSLTTVGSQTENSAAAHGLIDPTATATSLRGTARLVLGRDLTMMWRDPMRRMPILMVALVGIGWPFVVLQSPRAAYACLFAAVISGTQAAGAYAIEGSGLWLHLVAFGDRMRARGELWGHAATAVLVGGIVTVVSILIQATVRHGWVHVPAVVGLCAAGLGTSCAAAIYFGARLPYAVPQSRTSMFASRVPGQGGRAAASSLGVMFTGLIGTAPVAVLAVLGETVNPLFRWVTLIVGPIVGALALWWGVRLASEHYVRSAPEIFQTVVAGDRV